MYMTVKIFSCLPTTQAVGTGNFGRPRGLGRRGRLPLAGTPPSALGHAKCGQNPADWPVFQPQSPRPAPRDVAAAAGR
jgi:hypothetical protein